MGLCGLFENRQGYRSLFGSRVRRWRPKLGGCGFRRCCRAKGMSQIAQAAGLGRESLYKALSSEGTPEFATVLKVIRALGLKLKVAM